MNDKIVIELDQRDALIAHIESLQKVITKRNERIAELEAIVDGGKEHPAFRAALKREYKRGWKECAASLAESTRQAAMGLGKIRREALDSYFGAEEIGD